MLPCKNQFSIIRDCLLRVFLNESRGSGLTKDKPSAVVSNIGFYNSYILYQATIYARSTDTTLTSFFSSFIQCKASF